NLTDHEAAVPKPSIELAGEYKMPIEREGDVRQMDILVTGLVICHILYKVNKSIAMELVALNTTTERAYPKTEQTAWHGLHVEWWHLQAVSTPRSKLVHDCLNVPWFDQQTLRVEWRQANCQKRIVNIVWRRWYIRSNSSLPGCLDCLAS